MMILLHSHCISQGASFGVGSPPLTLPSFSLPSQSEAQADTRLVAQILDQRMLEEQMLEKMQELMER